MVQEGLAKRDWLAAHSSGFAEIEPILRAIPVAHYAQVCGVDETLLRSAARRIASAASTSVFEDLGLQMTLNSTLSSYLQRLIWVLGGHYGRVGTSNAFVPFLVAVQGQSWRSERGQGQGPARGTASAAR